MPMVINSVLPHLVMCSVAWGQLLLTLKQFKRLWSLVAIMALPGIAQSQSQPIWAPDVNQFLVTGVTGNSTVYRELVRDLTLEAVAITGLSLPGALPPVVLVDKDIVAKYACAGKCRALGAYHPNYGIALDHTLDPLNDDLARSILIHELVHYLQHENGLYANNSECTRWLKREEHAYSAQNKFLRKIQSTTRVAIPSLFSNRCGVGSG